MTSIVLTTPVSGSTIPGSINTQVIVPYTTPNNTVIIDSVPDTGVVSVKWIYTITNQNNDAIMSAEILGVKVNGQLKHTRYAMIGDTHELIHKIELVITGSNEVGLKLTNLSSMLTDVTKHTDYIINIVRIQSF